MDYLFSSLRRLASQKLLTRTEPSVQVSKWYSNKFSYKYWEEHYYTHINSANKKKAPYFFSATYDLSLLYLTQSVYGLQEFEKIKSFIRKISIYYLKKDSHENNYIRTIILENILFAYVLGLLNLEEEELALFKKKIESLRPLKVNLGLIENSEGYFIFPYFALLFAPSFSSRKIVLSLEKLEDLRSFFTREKVLRLCNQFVSFCTKNEFGVYQLKQSTGKTKILSSYRKLLIVIDENKENFLTGELSLKRFDVLKDKLNVIKEEYEIL